MWVPPGLLQDLVGPWLDQDLSTIFLPLSASNARYEAAAVAKLFGHLSTKLYSTSQGVSRLSHHSQSFRWRSLSSASPINERSPRPGLQAANQQNPPARSFSAPRSLPPKLAPSEVTSILRNNEYTCSNLPAGSVKFFDTNSLQSNHPIEDSSASALTVGGGYLFGVFDGHGGAACGQVNTFVCSNLIQVDFYLFRWSPRGCYITLLLAC